MTTNQVLCSLIWFGPYYTMEMLGMGLAQSMSYYPDNFLLLNMSLEKNLANGKNANFKRYFLMHIINALYHSRL